MSSSMSWVEKKENRYMAGMLAGATTVGVALGYAFLPGEWEIARRVIAGAVFGLWCAMLVLCGRLYL